MTESSVDLLYRGLVLGKRAKLTSVRPREGFVELAAPMPVGSQIALVTDEGVTIEAKVTGVVEQTGGATATPGMQIAPVLEGAQAEWWRARVELPDPPAKLPRTITVPMAAPPTSEPPAMPAPITAPMPAQVATEPPPVPASPVLAAAPVVPAAPTVAMAAVPEPVDEVPRAVDDDGKATQIMAVVDLAALGLETSASGSIRAMTADDADADELARDSAPEITIEVGDSRDDPSKPASTAGGKKKRKRR